MKAIRTNQKNGRQRDRDYTVLFDSWFGHTHFMQSTLT